MKLGITGIFNRDKAARTEVTTLNLKWHGETHHAPGLKTSSNIFDVVIPFHNRQEGTDTLQQILKSTVLEDISVQEISVGAPFRLVGIEPRPPITIKYGNKVDFKLAIEAPPYSFKGPLEISFIENEPDKVRVEINRIVLVHESRNVPIPSTEMAMNIRKSQAFRVSVQLYKILSYGDKVHSISVNAPFKFISSMPEPPFTIDNKNSFMVTIFVQAPEIGYGGPLEIEIR
ncbi:MAG: hypothetical protein ACP5UH_01855 [Candidatus Micrarchaeia archaeon]